MDDKERRIRLAEEIDNIKNIPRDPYWPIGKYIEVNTRINTLEWVRDNLDLGELK